MSSLSILGAGHLAQSLLEGLAQVTEMPVRIFNRTPARVEGLLEIYPHLIPVEDLTELPTQSAFILLIVPADAIMALDPRFIRTVKQCGAVLVSCSVVPTLMMLEEKYPGVKIVRAFPNVNWRIRQGVTPIIGNALVAENEMEELASLLEGVSSVHRMDCEEAFDRLGMLCSCGPGLMGEIVRQMCEAFGIVSSDEVVLVYRMVCGSMDSLISSKAPGDLLAKVATSKWSLTRAGVESLAVYMPETMTVTFERMADLLKQRRETIK